MKRHFDKNKITPKQVIDIVLIAILLLFIFQNLGSVKVKFLFFGFELPLIVLIIITFLIGLFTSKVFKEKNKVVEKTDYDALEQ